MLLEEQAQVEQRLLQNPGIDQHQHDQEPAQATVAVQKRVDGFELHMGQGSSHQHRQGMGSVRRAMDEVLQLPHARVHQPRWRRHEAGVARSGAADPVLTAAELPRQPVGSAAPGQQPGVDFAQQTGGEREALPQPCQAVLQSRHVA